VQNERKTYLEQLHTKNLTERRWKSWNGAIRKIDVKTRHVF